MKCKQSKSAVWGKKVLVALTLILSASLAFAGPRKMSHDLESRASSSSSQNARASKISDTVDVIVQFKHEPGTKDHQRVANHGGKLKRQFGHFRGALYTVSAARLAELANDSNVAYVSPNRPIHGSSTSASAWKLDYHNETINTAAATALGLDGAGIGVAGIDSGGAHVFHF